MKENQIMKYRHGELTSKPGIFAVLTGSRYFTDTETESEQAAKICALKMSAQWYRAQMDAAHSKLESLGAIDAMDPYDYLA